MDREEPAAAEAIALSKIAEGREAEIFRCGEHDVLRLYRDPNAGDRADREILALDAVRAVLPCVPTPHGRMDWNGRPGIRMQRLDGRGILCRAYLAGYRETTRYDEQAVRRWTFVRAVDRLADDIAEERGPLLGAAERLRRGLAPRSSATA